jgi:hypothetical protein
MNGLRSYLIGISVVLVIYLIAQYYRPKPTDWSPTYLSEDKIPFGTYILNQHIRHIFPHVKFTTSRSDIYSTLKEPHNGTFVYFILADKIKISKLDYRAMVSSMKAGNQIFIAASKIEGGLLNVLKLRITSDLGLLNQTDTINFLNPSLKRKQDYVFEKNISDYYFSVLDTSRAVVLGEQQQHRANFVKYTYGKGALYILPNPKLFTNYSLLKDDGVDYTSKALSYLPKTKQLILDEYFTRPSTENQSILRVLFQYDKLRWAYYISIFSLLAFVLFEIKRRQRVIPVLERLKNSTVEFVEVVGRVYYQQRNNRDIAEKKVTYLLAYIRTKYRLKTVNLDLAFKNALINISGAEADLLDELLNEISYLNAGSNVKDEQLIRLNKLIEEFYKQDQ